MSARDITVDRGRIKLPYNLMILLKRLLTRFMPRISSSLIIEERNGVVSIISTFMGSIYSCFFKNNRANCLKKWVFDKSHD